MRDALQALSHDPSRSAVFQEMWPEVCSEGTTYDVAFAAAPYLVGIADQVTPVESIQYLIVLGLIETYADAVPEDLKPTYSQAVSDALASL